MPVSANLVGGVYNENSGVWHCSISAAVAAATAGDTLRVSAGTYVENVNVNKALTINGPFAGVEGNDGSRGTGEAVLKQTVAGSPGIGCDATAPLTINSADVVVDGIELNDNTGGCVVRFNAGPASGIRFVNNRVIDFTSTSGSGGGLYVSSTDGVEIAGNLLRDFVSNTGSGYWAMGIKLMNSTNAQVHDNVFRDVSSVNIQLSSTTNASVHHNDIDAAARAGIGNAGVQLAATSNSLVRDNTISTMDTGILWTPGNDTSSASVCNTISDSTRGIFAMGPPWPGTRTHGPILHNALSANYRDIRSTWNLDELVIGSNWYGGASATVDGPALVADALPASPIGSPLCGNNAAHEIVAYAGSGAQSTPVDTAFSPLRARVQDQLGGAVAGQTVNYTVPGSGASAVLGTASGTTNYNGELISTATANSIAGSYAVTASSGSLTPDASFALENTQGTATITLIDPAPTYDGNPHAVAVTTTPSGLEGDVQIVYTQGMTTVATCAATNPACGPVNAGVYTATATIVGNPNYTGSGTGTLTIQRAATTIEFLPNAPSFVYDGNAHDGDVSARLAAEPGTSCPVTGAIGPNVGSYPVNAAACTGTNYEAPAAGTTATVTPQPTTISFSYLTQAYDGSPKSVVATTAPSAGVPLAITYNGSPTPPTAVGSYSVVATVTDPNYSGSNSATLQIVNGLGDIALVLNGPVDPIHVGDTAQYAATMLANPALHTGELYGYHVVLSKSGGDPLALSDIATMEVYYGGAWVDATSLFGSIPFTIDGGGNLVYDFPDGIPGYPGGFPILDASWTWNVRLSFATPGTYTLSTTLTDGIGGPAIVPTVAASIATVVLDALPATDIHLALGGPAESIEVAQVAEYTGTLIADPSLHVGEDFFVKVSISKSGGHPLVPADLATMEMYYGGVWTALPPGEITQPGGPGTELLYHFPKPAMPGGFEITSPTWTWNFRFGYADVGVYTAVAEVIHAADEGNPLAHVFATAAVATTVVDATPHLPDVGLLLTGPLDDIELGDAAQYTGTLLAEPALYTGQNFWVRIRISKSGGSHALVPTDLAMMELYQGGWQDHTATLQPLLVADGADLVYYFPQPFGAFTIDNAIFSWNFRFTYGDTGVYTATADLIDAADPVPLTAPALASASVETTVIDTPDIHLDVQGAVTGMVGTPVQYVGTLTADPLPDPANRYFVEVRIQRDGGLADPSDISKAEIFWGGMWVDPVADLGLTIPWTVDGNELVYLFPQPVMPTGFPIDEPTWTWQFRFTYANAGLYTATATVVTADGSATPVSNTESIQTAVSVLAEDIHLTLNGPVAGVEVESPTAYIGRLQNLGGDLAENGYVHVRIEMASQTLVTADVTLEVWDGSAWVTGPVSEVAGGLEVAFPDALGFAIPAGFDFTHQFRITYHRTGVFHATATVVGATSGDSYASAEMFTEVVPQAIVTASVLFDPASLLATYNGSPHAASATTVPAGLTLAYTYNGSSTPPTAAGSYVVQATVDDPLFQGSATAVLVIDKANGSVSLAPLSGVYGSAHAVTAMLVETDTNVSCSVAGVPAANAPVGNYPLVAECASDNYTATASATYVVTPVAAGNTGILLTGGTYTYDGAAHAAGVSNPNGVAYVLAYAPGGAVVPVDAGTYDVTLTITDANYAPETLTAQVVIAPASVTLAFGNLAQVYDGAPKAASVTATPDVGGISLAYSQGGGAVTPIDAGSYDVEASLANPNYVLSGATTATLVIAKATGTVTFGPTSYTFDGSGHTMTAVITQESGNLAACVLTPVGDDPRVHAGSTTYSAACTGDNHVASGSTTLTVAPKPVTIALSDLGPYVYDGAVHAASASVSGEVAGFPAALSLSYNGSPGAPSAVGSYNVVAALDAMVTDYVATPASGVLVIGEQNASVTLGDLAVVYDGNPHAASVVTTPAGLAVDVTYDGDPTAPTDAGSYSVVATITEAGYSGSASGTLTIARAPATLTISDTTQPWDGTPRAVTVVTNPASLTVDVTYDGSATPPTAVGSYAVFATITDPNYEGSATATLHITNGAAGLIQANGTTVFSGTAGAPLTGAMPSVLVTDAGGNPVAGVEVSFAPGVASGVLSGAVQTTNQNGIATLGGWTLDPVAGANTVTATAAGVTGEVVFTATGTTSTTGLSVTISDGRTYAQFDRLLTWAITVGNAGPSSLQDVEVEAILPAELSVPGASWQCIALAGASCTATGTGDLVDSVDLPAGSSVVYLLNAMTTRDGSDRIELTVEATGPAGVVSATDTTDLLFFRDGFEVGGDGISWIGQVEPLGAASFSEEVVLMLDVAPAALSQLQRVVLAQAVDRSFQVEAMAIGNVVLVRLLADDTVSAWTVLDSERVALVLVDTQLALVGARDDVAVDVRRGGSFTVELFTRH